MLADGLLGYIIYVDIFIFLYTGKSIAEAKEDASKCALFELHNIARFEGNFLPTKMLPQSLFDRLKSMRHFNDRSEADYFLTSLNDDVSDFDAHPLAVECKKSFEANRDAIAGAIYQIFNYFCFCKEVRK
jgi:hypothetical protein